jgi:DNA helicase HerA-like ATPase
MDGNTPGETLDLADTAADSTFSVRRDYARPVGRVISVNGSLVRGLLITQDAGGTPMMPAGLQIGAIVRVATPRSSVYGVVGALEIDDPAPLASQSRLRGFEIQLLGEAVHTGTGQLGRGFERGVAHYPLLDEQIFLATPDELAHIYARPAESNVRIGTIHPDHILPAYLTTDDLLGKHFAILGSTGSGKSCSTALILQAILQGHPHGHVILLDPHNEYSQAFKESADVLNPANLQLPYWLLNYQEMVEVMIGRNRPDMQTQAAILRAAIVAAKIKFVGDKKPTDHITVDTPVPFYLGDLLADIDHQLGDLDKPENSVPFLRLKSRIEGLRGDRRYSFMFSGLVVQDSLPNIMSRLLSIPVEGKPVTIVDLSGVPSEIVDVVVSVLCRMIFDFALWSVPAKALPVLLVCEEAHRYVPVHEDTGFEPTKRTISRIAMEGRKYGVSLCLVTQRPSELSANILSQCNTMFALRMSNERDQEIVRRALPENAHGLLSALPSLRTQEAVVVGEGVALPVRLRFNDLAPEDQPRSASAAFSAKWQSEDRGREFVVETVERWRQQTRSVS